MFYIYYIKKVILFVFFVETLKGFLIVRFRRVKHILRMEVSYDLWEIQYIESETDTKLHEKNKVNEEKASLILGLLRRKAGSKRHLEMFLCTKQKQNAPLKS